MICNLKLKRDNLKFEIWKKKLEICVGKVGNFEEKWKSGKKLKLGKILNLENVEILKNLEILKNFELGKINRSLEKFWKF